MSTGIILSSNSRYFANLDAVSKASNLGAITPLKISSGDRFKDSANITKVTISDEAKQMNEIYAGKSGATNQTMSMTNAASQAKDVLTRMKTIAEQGQSDVASEADKKLLNEEFQNLNNELGKIFSQSESFHNSNANEQVKNNTYSTGINTSTTVSSQDVSGIMKEFGTVGSSEDILKKLDDSLDKLNDIQNYASNKMTEVVQGQMPTIEPGGRIKDVSTDVESVKTSVLEQLKNAGASIMSQANTTPPRVLSLLQ